MYQRFRQILVTLVATAAAATTTLSLAGPAAADPGVSCTAPSISGSVMPGFLSNSNRVYVMADGTTSANCTTPFFNYKYELSYYPAAPFTRTISSQAAEVQSTSLTNTGTSLSPRTSIAFPDASWTRTQSYYGGVYVAISSYSKSPIQQTWPTEPANVDWYFIQSFGSYDTATMAQDAPPNLCQALGYTKGGC
jgi:hypothetical protein